MPIIATAPKLRRKAKPSQASEGEAEEKEEVAPRLLITGVEGLDKKVKALGGTVVNTAREASHLVAPKVRTVCLCW